MNIIYTIRTSNRNGTRYTHDYEDAYWAWADFKAAASLSGFDLYTHVELVEINKEEQQEYPLAELTFPV